MARFSEEQVTVITKRLIKYKKTLEGLRTTTTQGSQALSETGIVLTEALNKLTIDLENTLGGSLQLKNKVYNYMEPIFSFQDLLPNTVSSLDEAKDAKMVALIESVDTSLRKLKSEGITINRLKKANPSYLKLLFGENFEQKGIIRELLEIKT